MMNISAFVTLGVALAISSSVIAADQVAPQRLIDASAASDKACNAANAVFHQNALRGIPDASSDYAATAAVCERAAHDRGVQAAAESGRMRILTLGSQAALLSQAGMGYYVGNVDRARGLALQKRSLALYKSLGHSGETPEMMEQQEQLISDMEAGR